MPSDTIENLALAAHEAWLSARSPAAPRTPPTFMVGPPRCGTTLPALHALGSFEFAYVPNAAKRRKRAPLAATARELARDRWTPQYGNRYGEADGPLAPSDGWDVFDRFFERYREARAADAERARGLTRVVAGLERLFDAPFFVKNNANSMRVEALARLFPGALFVHVTRDYPEAARSLLEARRRHGAALGEWWSSAPPQFLERTFSDELEQVAVTLGGIDAYLRDRLPQVAPQRHLELRYEAFCERPDALVDWLEARYADAGVRLRRRTDFEPAGSFEVRRLAPDERAPLERAIAAALRRFGIAEGS